MYHILSAQGQTQFGRREDADQAGFRLEMPSKVGQLAPPVLGPVGGLDQPGGLAGFQRGLNLLEPRGKLARPLRKAQAVEKPPREQPLDLTAVGAAAAQVVAAAGKVLAVCGTSSTAVGTPAPAPSR